jgi:hypothetical protein
LQFRLTDYIQNTQPSVKPDINSLGFFIAEQCCPVCGSDDTSYAGWRKNKRKEDTRRLLCNKCGRLFTLGFDRGAHLPLWVWDTVLFYAMLGVRYKSIPHIIKRESIIRGLGISTISVPTVYSIVNRSLGILDKFERNIMKHIICGKICEQWEIDDRYHNIKKIRDEERKNLTKLNPFFEMFEESLEAKTLAKKKRRTKWKYMYPTAVVAREAKYCLAVYVGAERNRETAEKALMRALQLVSYEPKIIYCDGHSPFLQAIPRVCPNASIVSINKGEDISVVNITETMWSIFNLVIPKKRFRKPQLLDKSINLTRHYYNMLRSQPALAHKTPLESLGFQIPQSSKESWVNLLSFAHRFNVLANRSMQQIANNLKHPV